MWTILMLPLDERPCNDEYPAILCEGASDLTLLLPPRELLGDKKDPARCDALRDWLLENIPRCDAAVISVDMLVYGGIAPSRTHHLSPEACLARLDMLRSLREIAPKTKLYLYNLIMRAPAYSSSEEEPDYYAQYGREINQIGRCEDLAEQGRLAREDAELLNTLTAQVPAAVLGDFTERRRVNHMINERTLDIVDEGLADFLVIPLDDCAQAGWAAREQRALRLRTLRARLGDRVFLYSGADEVGCVLLTRAANALRGRSPAVWVRYSAVNGPYIIPKYEDRPLGENIKWQIAAAGGHLSDAPDDADLVLMVNAPTVGGESMGETYLEAEELHASYFSQRCLPEFCAYLLAMLDRKPVALADVALANGADGELMTMLHRARALSRLAAYGAWNTAANTIGMCVAQCMLGGEQRRFTHLRLMEDWLYMAEARQQTGLWMETELHMDDHITAHGEEIERRVRQAIQRRAEEIGLPVRVRRIRFPWKRLFEIGVDFDEISAG